MTDNQPDNKPTPVNIVHSNKIRQGQRNAKYNLDKAIEEAVNKDRF